MRAVDPHEVDVAPLSFGASSTVEGDYVAPRAGLLRALRVPLVVSVVAVGLIAITWSAWSPVMTGVADGAATLAAREGDGRTRESATIALATIALLSFAAAWWTRTHPRRPLRLSDGRGTMEVDALAGQLRVAILDLPEVREAEVVVENRGGGRVRVRTWVRITADARIDDALDGVDDAADWLVHHRLGLLLSEPPLAVVRYDELDLRNAGGRRQPDGDLP